MSTRTNASSLSSTPSAAVSPEALLRHREWVRRLARRLAVAGHDADDLEQDVWLAAMRSPPPEDRGIRSWLRRVMRNRLHEIGRADARRGVRETAAARRDVDPATVDAVAEIEAHGRLVQAVLALDEPYRTTLVLRFFREMPPRAVAERMGVPVETVRTRTKRGVAKLRGDLENRGGLACVLVPLLGLPESAWAHIGTAASTAAGSTATATTAMTATTTGVLAMALTGKQVAGIAAVLLCGVGAVFSFDRLTGSPGSDVAHVEEPAAVLDRARRERHRDHAPTSQGEETAATADDEATDGATGVVLQGTVCAPDGAPLGDVGVVWNHGKSYEWRTTGADGAFSIEEFPLGELDSLRVLHPRYRIGRVVKAPGAARGVVRVELETCDRVRVSGVVVDTEGAPVPAARVVASPESSEQEPRWSIGPALARLPADQAAVRAQFDHAFTTVAASDGSYILDLPAAFRRCGLKAHAPGFAQTQFKSVVITEDRAELRANLTLRPLHSVGGHVFVAGTDAPFAGAEIVCWDPTAADKRVVAAVCDARGMWSLTPKHAGELYAFVRAPGFIEQKLEFRGQETTFDVRLERAFTIAGVVLLPDGKPVNGAGVSVSLPSRTPDGVARGAHSSFVLTDGGGRFRFDNLWEADWRVYVGGAAGTEHSFHPTTLEAVAAGTTRLVVEVAVAPSIEGTVQFADGTIPSGVAVRCMREFGDRGHAAWGEVNARGGLRLLGLEPGAFTIVVSRTNRGSDFLETRVSGITAGTHDVRIVLDRGLTIAGRVVDADGDPVRDRVVLASHPDDGPLDRKSFATARTDRDGRFELAGLEAGESLLHLTPEPPFWELTQLQGGENVAAGTMDLVLELHAGGTIEGRLLDSSGAPLRGIEIAAMRDADGVESAADPRDRFTITDAVGAFRLAGLPSQHRHSLFVLVSGHLPIWRPVDHGTRGLELRLDRGLSLSGVLLDADGAPVANTQVSVQCEGLRFPSGARTDETGAFAVSGLVRGPCTIRTGWGENAVEYGTVEAGSSGLRLSPR